MASFTQSLRTFRDGNISYDELLEQLNLILADDLASATWLLAELNEEDKNNPLPANINSALRNKLEPLSQKEIEFATTGDGELIPLSDDIEVTQLASDVQPNSYQRRNTDKDTSDATELNDGIDPIKGTGDVLNNRFVLQECVGTGGMGAVYKALDRRKIEANDRHPYVAVKVLNLEFRAHPDSLIALQREAKKSQGLAHPNIVRVYDFDRDGSTVYMTMEYLSGVTLRHKMKAPNFSGLPRDEALMIINNAGHALRFAHECGIVHTDFKPANVFITDNEEIKIIDFGIARAFQRDETVELEATRFDPGTLKALTPSYASPEMLDYQKPDPRDDIYALACTAYEMLTGHHPFGRVPASVANETGLKLSPDKKLTRMQFTALKHALEFDRRKRTATVDQFLKEINRTNGVIGKSVSAFGLVLLMLGVAAGYYYISGPGVDVLTGIMDRDSQSRSKGTGKADPLALPVTAADNAKPNNQQINIQREPPVKSTDNIGQASAQQHPVEESISIAEVTPLISSIDCSAINVRINDDKLYMKGFALQRDKKMMRKRLSGLASSSPVDFSGIDTVDEHQCSILDRLSGYWWANQGIKNRINIASNKPNNSYLEGDNLILKITTPNYSSFIYVDYYLLDSGVLHMVPSPRIRGNQAPANYHATIGDLGEWSIARPFGTELIVIMATPEPLFTSQRKEIEPQNQYLFDLEKRLSQLAKKNHDEQITVDFIVIRTKPKTGS